MSVRSWRSSCSSLQLQLYYYPSLTLQQESLGGTGPPHDPFHHLSRQICFQKASGVEEWGRHLYQHINRASFKAAMECRKLGIAVLEIWWCYSKNHQEQGMKKISPYSRLWGGWKLIKILQWSLSHFYKKKKFQVNAALLNFYSTKNPEKLFQSSTKNIKLHNCFNIDNNKKISGAPDQPIRISDIEDWSNGWENFALAITGINYILIYIEILYNVSLTIFFDEINARLGEHKAVLLTLNLPNFSVQYTTNDDDDGNNNYNYYYYCHYYY